MFIDIFKYVHTIEYQNHKINRRFYTRDSNRGNTVFGKNYW